MKHYAPLASARAKTIWLLGHPVAHSLSPLMQNVALRHLSENVVYLAADVDKSSFQSAVDGLVALGALGANVTVPYKELAYSMCDELDVSAQAIGACNVLRFKDGKVDGYNTDWIGWLRAMQSVVKKIPPSKALVVGAGGASRAVVYALLQWGVSDIVVLNRSLDRAERLVQSLASGRSTSVKARPLEEFYVHLDSSSLVVQTTSIGLDGISSPVELKRDWPKEVILSELIYGLKTPLLKHARLYGGLTQDGLPMLVNQAALSLSIWLERPLEDIPTDEMIAKARLALG